MISISPDDDAFDLSLGTVARFEFSEPIDPDSLQSVSLFDGTSFVNGFINEQPILGGRVFVFTPEQLLVPNRTYTAVLTGPLQDLAGNVMQEESFTTSFSTLDTVPPIIQDIGLPDPTLIVEGSTISLMPDFGGFEDVVAVEIYLNGQLFEVITGPPFNIQLPLDFERRRDA